MNIRLVLDGKGRVVMEARPSVREKRKSFVPDVSTMVYQGMQQFHSVQTHIITVPLETMQGIQRQIAENGVVYFVLTDVQEIKK